MGKMTLEKLFKDAAVLANKEKGIPHFCVEPERRKDFFQGLTRYSASKPLNQALNAIMSNRSFDEVMERFSRNLSVKIKREKEPELVEFRYHILILS